MDHPPGNYGFNCSGKVVWQGPGPEPKMSAERCEQRTPVLPSGPGVKSDLINCLVCQNFWHGPLDSECPHCAAQKPVDLHAILSALSTFRPVRLFSSVTMHRDVVPNEAGWIRREDMLDAIAKATGK